jgi:peptidyl-prolyl cis-trans isomerase SurA
MSRKLFLLSNLLLWVILYTRPILVLAETVDRIIARINNEIITYSDLEEASAPYIAAIETNLSDSEREEKIRELKKDILETLIEEKLIIDKAKSMNITVTEEEIDEAIEEVKKRHSLNDLQFHQLLEQQETTWEEYRENIKNQILLTRALNYEVRSKVELNESEAQEYYKKHRSEFLLPEDVKARQIFIQCPPDADPTERQRAETEAQYIHKLLLEGGDFAQLAKKYSQDPSADKGGDLGYIKKGELIESLEKVLFEMKEGEISPVIKTNRGFHILKVEEKRINRIKPFSEVKDTIMDKLFKKKLADRQQQWIEEIKKDSFVEVLY